MRRTAMVFAAAATLIAGPALAATEFRARAEGHAFQCGPRSVEFMKGGTATLSMRDDPVVRAAKVVSWHSNHAVLKFRGGGRGRMSAYGATVTLTADGHSAPCVLVQ